MQIEQVGQVQVRVMSRANNASAETKVTYKNTYVHKYFYRSLLFLHLRYSHVTFFLLTFSQN